MCITLRHEAYHRPGAFDFDNVQHLDDGDLDSDALQRNSTTSIKSRRSANYVGRRHSVSLAVQNSFDRVLHDDTRLLSCVQSIFRLFR